MSPSHSPLRTPASLMQAHTTFFSQLIHIHTSLFILVAMITTIPLLPLQLEQMIQLLPKQSLSSNTMVCMVCCMSLGTATNINSQLLLFVAEHPLFTLQLHGANQNTTVVCSATGGYPPITNISLLKNGNVVASTASESRLQVNAADVGSNHFGLYVCLVNLSGVAIQQNVVLKERGIVFIVQL